MRIYEGTSKIKKDVNVQSGDKQSVLTPHPPRILRACSSSLAHSRADFDDGSCERGASLCDFRLAMGINLKRGQLENSDYKDYAGGARSTAAAPLM